MMDSTESTIFSMLGGEETILRIVDAFYPKVQAHPLLRPIFPEDILPVKQKQFWFLTQLFGGPRLYSERFGHPMLRARHLPFPITTERAKAWLGCMAEALEEAQVEPRMREAIIDYLTPIAHHMRNTPDPDASNDSLS